MTVTSTQLSPCDWGVTWDMIASGCSPCSGVKTEADQALIVRGAVAFAWAATGRRFGVCEVTLRPCLWCGCSQPGSCGCYWYQRLDLNPGQDRGTEDLPVQSVTWVKEYGDTLEPNVAYRLQSNRWLLRLPQGARFPACQDEGAETAPLEVRWKRGTPPDDDLVFNGVLPFARELVKGFCGDDCSIDPSVVQSVSREGISFALVSPGEGWRDGLTGIPGVNAAIKRAWPLGIGTTVVGGMTDPLRLVRPPFTRVEDPTPT